MRFVTGLLFLIGSLFIYEQSLATPQELIETKKTEMRLEEALKRLKRVEDQFEIILNYNDDFFALIAGALGLVGTITVFLIGYNWFQTRKDSESQKREFDSLREKMIELIDSKLNESSSKIDGKLSGLDSTINKRVEIVTKSEIHNIKQVLLIHKYIELENSITNQIIKSKKISPYDLEKLSKCAVEIGACLQIENDLVTEKHEENYYEKLFKLIDDILNNIENKQCVFSLELSIAIEKSINMVPDESYVGDNSHFLMKKALMTRLQNIRNINYM